MSTTEAGFLPGPTSLECSPPFLSTLAMEWAKLSSSSNLEADQKGHRSGQTTVRVKDWVVVRVSKLQVFHLFLLLLNAEN